MRSLTLNAVRFERFTRCLPTIRLRYFSNSKQTTNIKFEHNNFLQLFHEQVINDGDSSAIIFDDHHVTYSEFYESCLQCALHLHEQYDVNQNDIVGCITGNIAQTYTVLISCQMLNAIYFPMNPGLSSDVIQHNIDTTKCKLIISESNQPFQNILYVNDNEPISWIENQYGNDIELMENNLSHIINNQQEYNPNNPSLLVSTSGSTGIPKIVAHCNKTMQHVLESPAILKIQVSKMLLTGQPYHMSSYIFLMTSACTGGCAVFPSKVMRQTESSNAEKALEMIRLTEFYGISRIAVIVTPIYEMVRLGIPFPKCVELIFSGGDIIPTKLMAKFIALHCDTDVRILNGYGATECGVIGMSEELLCTQENANNTEKIENHLMSITKHKDVKHRVEGKENELVVQTNSMMLGYYNDPEQTKQCFTDDGYYKTGDTISVIEDDPLNDIFRFMVIARRKHVIVSQYGYIYPFYIENELLSHSKINGAVVVGISENTLFDDESEYACPIGFVTVNMKLNELESTQLIEELLVLCKKSKYKNHVPHKIFILDNIPKLTIGKVAKMELAKIAREHFQNIKAK